jgi:hypothetical protein
MRRLSKGTAQCGAGRRLPSCEMRQGRGSGMKKVRPVRFSIGDIRAVNRNFQALRNACHRVGGFLGSQTNGSGHTGRVSTSVLPAPPGKVR